MNTTTDITTEMANELRANHTIAQAHIKQARESIMAAVDASAYLGQLVEKAQRSKRNTVFAWISEDAGIDGVTARAYRLAHITKKKRNAASDRRCLLKLGIIEPQVKLATVEKVKPQPMSLSARVTKASEGILKHIENQRPVEDMSQAEKVLLKSKLEPMARLFMEVSS